MLEFSISLDLSDLKLIIGTWFWAIRDGSIFQPTPRPGNCRKEQTAEGNFCFLGNITKNNKELTVHLISNDVIIPCRRQHLWTVALCLARRYHSALSCCLCRYLSFVVLRTFVIFSCLRCWFRSPNIVNPAQRLVEEIRLKKLLSNKNKTCSSVRRVCWQRGKLNSLKKSKSPLIFILPQWCLSHSLTRYVNPIMMSSTCKHEKNKQDKECKKEYNRGHRRTGSLPQISRSQEIDFSINVQQWTPNQSFHRNEYSRELVCSSPTSRLSSSSTMLSSSRSSTSTITSSGTEASTQKEQSFPPSRTKLVSSQNIWQSHFTSSFSGDNCADIPQAEFCSQATHKPRSQCCPKIVKRNKQPGRTSNELWTNQTIP